MWVIFRLFFARCRLLGEGGEKGEGGRGGGQGVLQWIDKSKKDKQYQVKDYDLYIISWSALSFHQWLEALLGVFKIPDICVKKLREYMKFQVEMYGVEHG